MPTAKRNGASLFYEEAGSGDPPIVFVHGLGSHNQYHQQIEHFSARHRVIAPDLPGFGRSDAPEREYSISAFAEDIVWLCNELQLQKPVIVGHSMSGGIALEIAANTDLPSALVLLDPIPIVAAPLFRERMTALVEAMKGPSYREALLGFLQNLTFIPTDDPDLRARIVDEISVNPQRVVAPAFESILSWDGERVASNVHVPVLMITAGDGIPADMARTREIMPAMELGRTVGVGHFAHVMDPDQVNAMIERFLTVSGVGKQNFGRVLSPS